MLTAVVALAMVATAVAQLPAEVAPSDSIYLFRDFNTVGKSFVYSTATESLFPGLDDVFNSAVVVGRGTWLLYSEPNFRGNVSIARAGRIPNPTAMRLGGSVSTLSSFRPLPVPSLATILIFEVRSMAATPATSGDVAACAV